MAFQTSSKLWLAIVETTGTKKLPSQLSLSSVHLGAFTIACIPRLPEKPARSLNRRPGIVIQEAMGTVTFRPKIETMRTFLRLLSKITTEDHQWFSVVCGDQTQLDQFHQMIIDDIWTNEQGLDATQQLLVLACVRMQLRDWLVDEARVVNGTKGFTRMFTL